MASEEPGPSGRSRGRGARSPTSSSSSSNSDEELSIVSYKFDPLKAIYSPRYKPDADAPVYDNVEKFVAVHEGRAGASPAGRHRSKKEEQPSSPAPQRQFTADQMPIPGKRRDGANVLTYMERQQDGPMSALLKLVKAKSRVVVCTRGARGERGRCRGFLVAFDKHWNLALADVDETFRRKRRGKEVVDGKSAAPRRDGDGKEDRVEYVGESRVRVVKTQRRTLVCERHVPQLLVRGEHVVFVSQAL